MDAIGYFSPYIHSAHRATIALSSLSTMQPFAVFTAFRHACFVHAMFHAIGEMAAGGSVHILRMGQRRPDLQLRRGRCLSSSDHCAGASFGPLSVLCSIHAGIINMLDSIPSLYALTTGKTADAIRH